jgi:hypothetical protein
VGLVRALLGDLTATIERDARVVETEGRFMGCCDWGFLEQVNAKGHEGTREVNGLHGIASDKQALG